MTYAGRETHDRVLEFTPAQVYRRVVAGIFDISIGVGLSVGVAITVKGEDLPPRYWNYFDYMVDIVNQHTEIFLEISGVGVGVFVLFETLSGWILGFTPVGRLFGLRLLKKNFQKPGVFRLLFRSVAMVITSIFGMIGPLFCLLDNDKRTLYDRLSGCFVFIPNRRVKELYRAKTVMLDSASNVIDMVGK